MGSVMAESKREKQRSVSGGERENEEKMNVGPVTVIKLGPTNSVRIWIRLGFKNRPKDKLKFGMGPKIKFKLRFQSSLKIHVPNIFFFFFCGIQWLWIWIIESRFELRVPNSHLLSPALLAIKHGNTWEHSWKSWSWRLKIPIDNL